MRIWAYCKGCEEWFACVRGIDGVVMDWRCPVCGLQPVSIQQSDGAPSDPEPGTPTTSYRRRNGSAREPVTAERYRRRTGGAPEGT